MYNSVAIFGLTGDPFTIAHRDICRLTMDVLAIDKLYMIPTIVSYHREEKMRWLTDEQRVECAKYMLWTLGTEYLGRWEIDSFEIDLKRLCYETGDPELTKEMIKARRFIHTILDFRSRIGLKKKITLVLGQDEVENLPNWYRWQDVCANISSLLCFGRKGCYSIPEEVKDRCEVNRPLALDNDKIENCSASFVRNYFKNKTLEDYLEAIKELDTGKTNLNTVPWII